MALKSFNDHNKANLEKMGLKTLILDMRWKFIVSNIVIQNTGENFSFPEVFRWLHLIFIISFYTLRSIIRGSSIQSMKFLRG